MQLYGNHATRNKASVSIGRRESLMVRYGKTCVKTIITNECKKLFEKKTYCMLSSRFNG